MTTPKRLRLLHPVLLSNGSIVEVGSIVDFLELIPDDDDRRIPDALVRFRGRELRLPADALDTIEGDPR
jgi:hypothetical protein